MSLAASAKPLPIPLDVAVGPPAGDPGRLAGRSLAQLRVGERGVVCEARVTADGAAVLRAMGLRPSASVRVCRTGEPCIVEIGSACGMSCRIGLARSLAEKVLISAPDAERA